MKECVGCRSLIEALSAADQPVSSTRIHSTFSALLQEMRPVKPLPPDPVLIVLTTGAFAAFSILIAALVRLKAFVGLTPLERIIYYIPIGFFGLLFSMGAVQSVIPGAKVRVQRGLVIGASFVVVPLFAIVLFPQFGVNNFVGAGIPCLRLGCISAALFGLLAAIVMRRGYVTDVRATLLLVGCFAGFAGVAVLSLHCPLRNAAHIIAWHLGAMIVSAAVALAIGLLARWKA